MRKKILLSFVTLLLLAGIGLGFVWTNLDHIVKSAIEKYGSAATQASVDLDSVSLALSTGEGAMSDLTVGNPDGFSTPYALHLNNISVKLDTASLRGTGPIVIEEIAIAAPQIYYEVLGNGKSNLSTLSDNAAKYTSGNESAARTAKARTEAEGTGRKVVIKNLRITDGLVVLEHHLRVGKSPGLKLPEIHLTNLGQKNKGLTPGEVTELVMKAITKNAARAAAGFLPDTLRNMPNTVMDGAAGGLDAVKGIFGK